MHLQHIVQFELPVVDEYCADRIVNAGYDQHMPEFDVVLPLRMMGKDFHSDLEHSKAIVVHFGQEYHFQIDYRFVGFVVAAAVEVSFEDIDVG